MSNFLPKGRRGITDQLLQFGVHLVYMEGTRTEPYYVDNIKNRIAAKYSCKPNDIAIIKGINDKKSRHTVELVNFALNDVKKRLQKKHTINHVWVFFDKDSFEDFEEAHKLIERQNNSKQKNFEGFMFDEETGISWHSCWSNECFELWLWLYYDYCEAKLYRDDYKDKLDNQPCLKRIGFSYEKNKQNIHDILVKNGGNATNAIKFAKKLNKKNGIDNPSSGVFYFFEYFYAYMV